MHYSLFPSLNGSTWNFGYIFVIIFVLNYFPTHLKKQPQDTFPITFGSEKNLPMKLHHEMDFFKNLKNPIHGKNPINGWKHPIPGWWFQRFCIFTSIWGRFPIWRIFFKGVGSTTNQIPSVFFSTNETPHWTVSPFRLDLPFCPLVLHLRGTRKLCSWRCPDAVGSDATSWKRRL